MRPLNLPPASHGAWHMLAEMHKPADPALLAVEIRRLHGTGLRVRDIAATLRLNIAVVLEALREAAV
jgi:hypothetical protein